MNKKIIAICLLSMFLFSSINAVGINVSNNINDSFSTLNSGKYDFGDIKVRTPREDDPARYAEVECNYEDHFNIEPGKITIEVDYDIDICFDVCNWVEININLAGIQGCSKSESKDVSSEKGKLSFSFNLEENQGFKIIINAKYCYEPPLFENYYQQSKEVGFGGSCGSYELDAGKITVINSYPAVRFNFNEDLPEKLDIGKDGAFLIVNGRYNLNEVCEYAGGSCKLKIKESYIGENGGWYENSIAGTSGKNAGSHTFRVGGFLRPNRYLEIIFWGSDGMGEHRNKFVDVYLYWQQGNSKPIVEIVNAPTEVKVGKTETFSFTVNDPENHKFYMKIYYDINEVNRWRGPFECGEIVSRDFSFDHEGNYDFKVYARDEYGLDAETYTHEIEVKKEKSKSIFCSEFLSDIFSKYPFFENLIKN